MNVRMLPTTMYGFVALALLAPFASAQSSKPAEAPPAHSQPSTMTVAILDFSADSTSNAQLGSQLTEAITAILSAEEGFSLVERTSIARTLQEHELNLTGVVDANKAIQIGKLVGAKILVTGKAFPLGKQLFITGKIIGTETSLVEGVLEKGNESEDLAELSVKFASKLAEKLRQSAPRLVAAADQPDPLPALVAKLKGRKLPTVAIVIEEQHFSSPQPRRVIDPAVETEVKLMLRQAGVTLIDVDQNDLADWARTASAGTAAWPRSLKGADLVITGKAFSEFASRIGNLVSCSARAEINVISRDSGKVVLADRQTSRAVDLSENIAGKKALEKAGHELGLRVLRYLDTAPVSQPAK